LADQDKATEQVPGQWLLSLAQSRGIIEASERENFLQKMAALFVFTKTPDRRM
jgi:hypothetical protein